MSENFDRLRSAFVPRAINVDVPRTYKVKHLVALPGKPSDVEVCERVGVREGDAYPVDPGALALKPSVTYLRPGVYEVLVTYMTSGSSPGAAATGD